MPKTPIQPFSMSDNLRDTLLLLRARTKRPEPTVTEAELAEIEEDLNGQLPSELLATMASLGWPLSWVVANTEQAWKRGLSREYAVFTRDEDGPWCVALGSPRSESARVGLWTGEDDEPFLDMRLNRYLRRRFDISEADMDELEAAADPDFLPGMIPTPVRRSTPTHVTHPKFGDGVVVQEIRDRNHKLVVDFPSGRRTLLARFVAPREVAA